jgi:hypothetical protein
MRIDVFRLLFYESSFIGLKAWVTSSKDNFTSDESLKADGNLGIVYSA